jgi:hypothetical protein
MGRFGGVFLAGRGLAALPLVRRGIRAARAGTAGRTDPCEDRPRDPVRRQTRHVLSRPRRRAARGGGRPFGGGAAAGRSIRRGPECPDDRRQGDEWEPEMARSGSHGLVRAHRESGDLPPQVYGEIGKDNTPMLHQGQERPLTAGRRRGRALPLVRFGGRMALGAVQRIVHIGKTISVSSFFG